MRFVGSTASVTDHIIDVVENQCIELNLQNKLTRIREVKRMINADIRQKIFESELMYKDVAAAVGVSHEHLSRLLAHPLSDQNRDRILAAIEQLSRRKTS